MSPPLVSFRGAVALVVAGALAAAPSIARAQDASPEAVAAAEKQRRASKLVEDSRAASDAGDHKRAIELLGQAYLIIAHPILLYNLGQAHALDGDRDQAAGYYRRFLATRATGAEAEAATIWLEAYDAPPAPPDEESSEPAYDVAFDARLARQQTGGAIAFWIGAALVVGGLVVIADGDETIGPLGATVGGASAIVGAIVWGNSRAERKRLRESTAIAPTAGHGTVGLSISGRW